MEAMFGGIIGTVEKAWVGTMDLDASIKVKMSPADIDKAGAVFLNMRVEDQCGCRIYMDNQINDVCRAMVRRTKRADVITQRTDYARWPAVLRSIRGGDASCMESVR